VRLGERIHAVAMERRRFGYRRVHDMLRSEFPGINHKKVFRLYRAQGLAVRKRNKGKKYRGERTPLVAAVSVNQTWSLDFVSDSLSSGRRIKCLTIADDFSHECVDIAVDWSMSGATSLESLIELHDSEATQRPSGRTTEPSSLAGPSWPGCRREVSSTS
jgi:putative transposase